VQTALAGFRLLMRVEHPAAREWHMREAADQHWSTRQLDGTIALEPNGLQSSRTDHCTF
jgi:predicted nuclease of restriction endonuclease-like (RecB) superfamily